MNYNYKSNNFKFLQWKSKNRDQYTEYTQKWLADRDDRHDTKKFRRDYDIINYGVYFIFATYIFYGWFYMFIPWFFSQMDIDQYLPHWWWVKVDEEGEDFWVRLGVRDPFAKKYGWQVDIEREKAERKRFDTDDYLDSKKVLKRQLSWYDKRWIAVFPKAPTYTPFFPQMFARKPLRATRRGKNDPRFPHWVRRQAKRNHLNMNNIDVINAPKPPEESFTDSVKLFPKRLYREIMRHY